jgi:hypothetical protein
VGINAVTGALGTEMFITVMKHTTTSLIRVGQSDGLSWLVKIVLSISISARTLCLDIFTRRVKNKKKKQERRNA